MEKDQTTSPFQVASGWVGVAAFLIALTAFPGLSAWADDWPHWRGPHRTAASTETGLISTWSQEGENLLWRQDFTGRSTPVVFDGRVCANGRAGEGIHRQEMVACFDAATGEKLWEHRFNVYHTTVPWNRVGWANVTGDPETAFLYVQGVGGLFFCFDSRNGKIVWSRNLVEELGFMEGYGGRTQTPVIDEDRLLVTFASNSWGDEAVPRHRFRAFDKRTGDLLWVSSPATSMADKNTQSTSTVAVVGGQRLMIAGNGDGSIFAVKARTGEPVWSFKLSKRGINTSVLVDGTTVYVSHSEENVDEPTLGRVVAIDATGSGDVTATHEKWRTDIAAGYSSATFHGGRLYLVDNSANLHALDAATGRKLWDFSLGTVGKGSPAWGEGKIYVTEVNGKFHILSVGAEGAESLDVENLAMPGTDRYAEIYGSPAIANGRIYFTSEEGLYCLGKKDGPGEGIGEGDGETDRKSAAAGIASPSVEEEPAPASAAAAALLAVPAELELAPGEAARFEIRAFDAKGRALATVPAAVEWTLEGLKGTLSGSVFTADPAAADQRGTVIATAGEVSARARVRVLRPLPVTEDFEGFETGASPPYLLHAVSRFKIEEKDGGKVLGKGPSPRKLHRHHTFIGSPSFSDYTLQADLQGTKTGRRVADMGLINSGYVLDLLGARQVLEIRSWAAALRMATRVDFAWKPGLWYTMKFEVRSSGGKALIRGKVWPRGETEPEAWSLTGEDPHPIDRGSPGLIAYSPSPVYFDNIEVRKNR